LGDPTEVPSANGENGPRQVGRAMRSLDMDKPTDPETPFREVYQLFLAVQ
jgi:hypothetical protein